MMHQACYLVRPKEALREALSAWKSDLASVLLEAAAFTQAESDRSSWLPEDRALQVKLVYLAWLRSEYGETKEYRALLGNNPVMVADFEKYWDLEVHSPDEVDWVVRQLDERGVVRSVGRTGSALVDDWATKALGVSLAPEE